jgi:hypothetical protein
MAWLVRNTATPLGKHFIAVETGARGRPSRRCLAAGLRHRLLPRSASLAAARGS